VPPRNAGTASRATPRCAASAVSFTKKIFFAVRASTKGLTTAQKALKTNGVFTKEMLLRRSGCARRRGGGKRWSCLH